MPKAESIVVPAQRTPSLWNRHLITGLKIGLVPVLGALAFGALSGTFGIILAVTSIVGSTAAGAYYGKSEMEQDLIQGHKIKPPSILNEGVLNGVLNGLLLGLGALAGFPGAQPTTLAAIGGATAATTVGLGYIQGKNTAAHMAQHYAQAQFITQQHGEPEKSRLLSKVKSAMPNMPATNHRESAELYAKMRNSPSKSSAVEALLNERATAELSPTEQQR